MSLKMLQGDCIEKMRELPENSIDSIVTDPPYELGFMNKQWDSTGIAFNIAVWQEALRVLKPGGHLLAFSAPRTYHRMACAIEDAGFEIRDMMQWLYGGGMPHGQNIGKAIDKKLGKERKVLGYNKYSYPNIHGGAYASKGVKNKERLFSPITVPSSEEAKTWSGWETALKPANEPIVLARKPFSEKTVVDNILHWGTGGINIDDTRIATHEHITNHGHSAVAGQSKGIYGKFAGISPYQSEGQKLGRFPSNVILDAAAAEILDQQSGLLKSGNNCVRRKAGKFFDHAGFGHPGDVQTTYGDEGGASRFFYVAKASQKERGVYNDHVTVKPIKLMEYLVTLVTPPLGTVLDPFAGSGTTGIACAHKGFNFFGIELDAHNWEICVDRLRRCK